ncbi:FAD-dependent oxidoreductase [Pseudonocardia spinosispora]|uniref:FAD-dependent oxidoreductase n=1 Tax=Pseudonocardia spinosispora TaxID=103441 RepID=UPI000492175B|nr:FAD-dependent oxidoreductase [Pseudonocardia spinosispora]
MRTGNVLVSGAGIAGVSTAYWLARHGWRVTVVERAPAPRAGGQAIDVRGSALGVVERMGVLDQVRGARTAIRGMNMVDAAGRELMRDTGTTLTGGVIANDDVELMRDDLSRILTEAIGRTVEFRFGDSVTAMMQDDSGVDVTFEHAQPRRFDLVVGADGLHSQVRALAFGAEDRFAHPLGRHIAIFSSENFLDLDHWQTGLRTPDHLVVVMSARHNTEARTILNFRSTSDTPGHRDTQRQKEFLAEHFAEVGWELPRLLDAMWRAPDFYFDQMCQIKLTSWSAGRIVLAGDAAHCASPMSGQGTSLALVGGYVLAGELSTADDHRAGFDGYRRAMAGYVAANQALATRDGGALSRPDALAEASHAITLADY